MRVVKVGVRSHCVLQQICEGAQLEIARGCTPGNRQEP